MDRHRIPAGRGDDRISQPIVGAGWRMCAIWGGSIVAQVNRQAAIAAGMKKVEYVASGRIPDYRHPCTAVIRQGSRRNERIARSVEHDALQSIANRGGIIRGYANPVGLADKITAGILDVDPLPGVTGDVLADAAGRCANRIMIGVEDAYASRRIRDRDSAVYVQANQVVVHRVVGRAIPDAHTATGVAADHVAVSY